MKRNVQDQIQVDLAVVTLVYVILYSTMFIACEIFGPLSSNTALDIALWMIQCLFNTGFNCIISLQLIHFCNIFGVTALNDWPESKQLTLSRMLVFPLGLIIGSGLCSVRAGACKKSPIYNYFIMDDKMKTNEDKFSLLSGISWFLYGTIIIIFQISIEVKRLLLNRADQRTDNLALIASNQLQKAIALLKLQNPVELGIHSLLKSDSQLSTMGMYPRLLQHFKSTSVSRKLNKVSPYSERTQRFVDYQKDQAGHQLPVHNHDHKNENIIRRDQVINIVDGTTSPAMDNLADNISAIEESQVQEINQSYDIINNLRTGQQGNGHTYISGPFQEPHQDASLTWKYAKTESEQIETHGTAYLFKPNNKLSRDQVKNYYHKIS